MRRSHDSGGFRGSLGRCSYCLSIPHQHTPPRFSLCAIVPRSFAKLNGGFQGCLSPGPLPFGLHTKPLVPSQSRAFRGTLHSKDRICPCAVLGAASRNLPREVAKEVEAFFTMCLDNLQSKGLSSEKASELLATITGAMVVANALGDLTYYDRATQPPSGGR
jgi:hypothetical protein